MISRCCGVFRLVIAGAVLSWTVQAGELSVKLTVREPAGVARKSAPACGGIPLPRGKFKKGQDFAVFDGGREIPAQVLPLVVDEKGFLRWVLVDFQTDLAAGARKEFALKAVKGTAKPASPLKLVDDAAGVTVDTGRVKFTIARGEPFVLFNSVKVGGKLVASGSRVSYTDCTMDNAGGKRYLAGKPSSIVVEYSGPMRVTVCVRGGFQGDEQTKMGYVARFTAWAGRSDVHVKYSLSNSNGKHYCYRQIKDSSIELKLAGEVTSTTLGLKEAKEVPGPAWMHQGLRMFDTYQPIFGHSRAGR